MAINAVIDALVKRGIFATEEEAVRELISGYILKQVSEWNAI